MKKRFKAHGKLEWYNNDSTIHAKNIPLKQHKNVI